MVTGDNPFIRSRGTCYNAVISSEAEGSVFRNEFGGAAHQPWGQPPWSPGYNAVIPSEVEGSAFSQRAGGAAHQPWGQPPWSLGYNAVIPSEIEDGFPAHEAVRRE